MMYRQYLAGWLGITCMLGTLSACSAQTHAAQGVNPRSVETVFEFKKQMPTGVTVSRTGRIFVSYPRWGDPVQYTVAEIRDGKEVPFPTLALNEISHADPSKRLVSVQSVVVDGADRLWLVDTGSIKFVKVSYGGPKLVCVDLKTNQVVQTILFPPNVALPTTYLNDVRFDLRRGTHGTAYLTDSSDKGPNGIIVVDLASGRSWRRLNDDPSTKAAPHSQPMAEGHRLLVYKPGKPPMPPRNGADGIALSADGQQLYYCPLIGRHLYSISTDALTNRDLPDNWVKSNVQDLGVKSPSDGLETDSENNLYVTDYEHHRVLRGKPGGPYSVLLVTPRGLEWPDTLAVAADGYLYLTANELQRQAMFNHGKDIRVLPYRLYRIKISQKPIAVHSYP